MELWQLDIVGGVALVDGKPLKCLTGVDDHSRYCVSATFMVRERTQPVCDAFAAALRTYGCPSRSARHRFTVPGSRLQPANLDQREPRPARQPRCGRSRDNP